jgi:tetratricopeptide (TPR) repeat protein
MTKLAQLIEARVGVSPDGHERKNLLIELASARDAQEEPELAYLALWRGFKEDPNDSDLRRKMENAAEAAKTYEELVSAYEEELPRIGDNVDAADVCLKMGQIYEQRLGEPDKAVEYYQKYLDAEPATPRAAEVRGLIAFATKAKQDAAAKKLAEEAAAAKEKAKIAAASHLKQADAFAKASAWIDAGNELREAFTIDADPAHLIAAGDAYRKGNALDKARDAYGGYLEKVPQGGDSDAVRSKLADVTTALEKAKSDADRLDREKAERDRLEKERLDREARGPARIEYDSSARDARRSLVLKLTIPGGILTLGGLVLGFNALQQKGKAKDNCDDANVCNDDGVRHRNDATKFARIADGCLAVGIGLTITGLVLWSKAPQAVEKKPQVVPTVSPTGAGVSLLGRF